MPLKRNYIDLISSRAVYAFHLNYIHQMWYRYYTGVKIESIMISQSEIISSFDIFYVIWAYFNICVLVGVCKWLNFGWAIEVFHSASYPSLFKIIVPL